MEDGRQPPAGREYTVGASPCASGCFLLLLAPTSAQCLPYNNVSGFNPRVVLLAARLVATTVDGDMTV